MIRASVCTNVCQEAERYGVGSTHACSPVCLELRAMQQDFEERALALFRTRRLLGSPMKGDNGAPLTQESLCWRKPNGDYGVELLNSAWAGYVWGYESQKGIK